MQKIENAMKCKGYPVRRYLAVFSKDTGFKVDEVALLKEELEPLQEIFGIDTENPMYDAYDVSVFEEQAMLRRGIIAKPLDISKCDYELHAS